MTKHLERNAGFRLALSVGLGLVVVDQISKNYARDSFQDGPVEIIGDWLRFTYGKNPGAAFSSFTGSGRLIGFIAVGVTVFILYMIAKTTRRVELVALGLILGGALGNLSDRIFRGEGFLDGAVVDWIDWWFIPTFNVADAALNVGVALLLISAVFLGGAHE